MARQSTSPVNFNRTRRTDENVIMTSGRAGNVQMLTYIPTLRGDSVSGRVGIDADLAEMPRPLRNSVIANFQAWFVPKSAFPQFSGMDEFIHSYQGEQIAALGQADRNPPAFFYEIAGTELTTALGSEMFKDLGLHVPAGTAINSDLIDAFWLVYNFRLAAHSSRLVRAKYASEDIDAATKWPRAFWPSGRFSRIVPDYERALIVGSLDLDVTAGQIPIKGLGRLSDGQLTSGEETIREAGETTQTGILTGGNINNPAGLRALVVDGWPQVFGEMQGTSVGVTLADIDMARTTQAFAKLRTAYAGNDATGFDNDDAIVAELMQGFRVPDDQFKRPWLLDSQRVVFGMTERHAMDGASLEESVTQGRASATLSLNVPATDTGGTIIVTMEVLPERLDERQSDPWLHITTTEDLPNALRDVQRTEPVDIVPAGRLDARHTTPDAAYGYEPMNDKWNRSTTRLGGAYYQEDPLNPWTEQRSAIWQTSIVDPEFTEDHWLAPADFPHGVFADTSAPAYEVVARHSVAIAGITQIGDVLAENNDDYEAVTFEDE